jgi:hypothetical protein
MCRPKISIKKNAYTARQYREVIMNEERVIVVSPQKSGTHLIQELMVQLGYGMAGDSRITADIEPKFDATEKHKLRRFALSKEEQEYYQRSSTHMRAALDREAWLRVARSWQIRLGAPVENRYGTHTMQTMESIHQDTELMRMRFAETPVGICWIYHQFDVKKIDGLFLQEWSQTQQPKIILNIRDPRDVIVSFVNYLCGKTGRGFGNFAGYQVMSRVLGAFGSFEEKLTYALQDVNFPGHGDLRDVYWLFKHPYVCTVRFEELIGPNGGGSVVNQTAAIERILAHLHINEDARRLADKVYNPGAFTFHKGMAGLWREHYTAQHLDLVEKRFGEVLDVFGYHHEENQHGHHRDGRSDQRTTLGSAGVGRARVSATQ